MCPYVHMFMDACVYECMFMYVHMCLCMHAYVCTHMFIHVYVLYACTPVFIWPIAECLQAEGHCY